MRDMSVIYEVKESGKQYPSRDKLFNAMMMTDIVQKKKISELLTRIDFWILF